MSAFMDSGHHWWLMCDQCEGAWFAGDEPADGEETPFECKHCSGHGYDRVALKARAEKAEADVARLTKQCEEDAETVRTAVEAMTAAQEDTKRADARAMEMCRVQEQEMQARLRAEADNAALSLRMNAASDVLHGLRFHHSGDEETGAHDEDCDACALGAAQAALSLEAGAHPGAALLERLRAADAKAAIGSRLYVLASHDDACPGGGLGSCTCAIADWTNALPDDSLKGGGE